MVQDARDFIEHHPYVSGAERWRDARQFLDGQHIAVFVAHHGDVVEAVHVADALVVRLGLGQFLGGPVQQPYVGVGVTHHLAVELEHQAQDAVRRRVLGPEIQGVVVELGHVQSPAAFRAASVGPASGCGWTEPWSPLMTRGTDTRGSIETGSLTTRPWAGS